MAASSGVAAVCPSVPVRLAVAAETSCVTVTSVPLALPSFLVALGVDGWPSSSARACSPATTVVSWYSADASAATSVAGATAVGSSARYSSGVGDASAVRRAVSTGAVRSSFNAVGVSGANVGTVSSAVGSSSLSAGRVTLGWGGSWLLGPSPACSPPSL
ncbi:hypothetical protein PF003_g1663 [Phytophthora fragariae]|nr:hypothetical protein PF003_g1663 [Phytophthora fragariae]